MTFHKLGIFFGALLLPFTVFAPAYANDTLHEVVKSDGIASYRLLPVHYDPLHANVVEQRLERSALATANIPDDYVIPQDKLPPIRDQGQRGTCAYFATVGLLEHYYDAQSPGASLTLSEECLVDVRNWMFDTSSYTGADKPAQRPDPNGDLPNSIIQTITADGVPAAINFGKTDCTYQSQGSDLSLDTYLGLFNGSYPYGKGTSFDQNTAPTFDAIEQLIAQNIPVEVGILVYNDFFSTDDWSYGAGVEESGIAGGHAVQLVGYHRSSDGKRVHFDFKNSWGSGWGRAGFGTLNDWLLTKSWGYDPSFDFIVSLH